MLSGVEPQKVTPANQIRKLVVADSIILGAQPTGDRNGFLHGLADLLAPLT